MTAPTQHTVEPKTVRPRRGAGLKAVVLVVLLASALFASSGCALFGLDDGWGIDLPISAKHTVTIPIDLTALPTSGQTAPQRLEIPLPLQAIPVDLTNVDPELNANKDKLESVEITQITVKPVSNSVTADIPPINLYIGPSTATVAADGERIATIPTIPAGSMTAVGGQFNDPGMAAAQPFITSLQFTFIPESTLVVEAGQNVPSGAAELELTLEITATVDPTK